MEDYFALCPLSNVTPSGPSGTASSPWAKDYLAADFVPIYSTAYCLRLLFLSTPTRFITPRVENLERVEGNGLVAREAWGEYAVMVIKILYVYR